MSEPGVLLSCGSGGLDGREGAKAPGWGYKGAGSPWSGCESVEGSWGIRGSACGPGRRGTWRPCGRRDLPSSSPGLARGFRRRGCEVSGCRRDLPGTGGDGCGFCAQCTSGRGILRAAPPEPQGGDPVWAFSCGGDGDRLLVGRGAVEVVCGVGQLARAKRSARASRTFARAPARSEIYASIISFPTSRLAELVLLELFFKKILKWFFFCSIIFTI